MAAGCACARAREAKPRNRFRGRAIGARTRTAFPRFAAMEPEAKVTRRMRPGSVLYLCRCLAKDLSSRRSVGGRGACVVAAMVTPRTSAFAGTSPVEYRRHALNVPYVPSIPLREVSPASTARSSLCRTFSGRRRPIEVADGSPSDRGPFSQRDIRGGNYRRPFDVVDRSRGRISTRGPFSADHT